MNINNYKQTRLIIWLLLFVLNSSVILAQNPYSSYIPGTKIQTKNVNVVFWFLLKTNGTGNWGPTSDSKDGATGYSNAYIMATALIKEANIQSEDGRNSGLQYYYKIPGLPAVYDFNYGFSLAEVKFIYDDILYNDFYNNFPENVQSNWVENIQVKNLIDENNYFNYMIFCRGDCVMGSDASIGGNTGRLGYFCNGEKNNPINKMAHNFRHENGHNIGLNHTITGPDGACEIPSKDWDGLEDTPTKEYLDANWGHDFCTQWTTGYHNNTLMCSSQEVNGVLTPMQLGRIHYQLSTYHYNKWIDNETAFAPIASITSVPSAEKNAEPFIAPNITIGDGITPLIIPSQRSLVVLSNSIVIEKGFTASSGSGLYCAFVNPNIFEKGAALPILQDVDSKKLEYYLYPNPSNGLFTLQSDTPIYLEILTIVGKVIYSDNLEAQENIIDIVSQPAGIYFMKINNKNTSITECIIKK